MSCCGNKREQQFAESYRRQYPSSAGELPATIKTIEDVLFEYIGQTGLTVTGGITSRRYRFSETGDKQLVDYRDAGGMMGVAVLRKVIH